MRKTTIQGIINVTVLVIYIIFVIRYSQIDNPIWDKTTIYIIGYLVMLSVILLSKYVIYRRIVMIYFASNLMIYSFIIFIFRYNIASLINKYFGLFMVATGGVSLLFYSKTNNVVYLRFGRFVILLGVVLLILFNWVISG